MDRTISHAELLELKRWNTPTVYNGWEQITRHNTGRDGFNLETVTDYMPQMGPMVGYALTVVIEPGNREHAKSNPDKVKQYREYVASMSGPKIVVVQDLDKEEGGDTRGDRERDAIPVHRVTVIETAGGDGLLIEFQNPLCFVA